MAYIFGVQHQRLVVGLYILLFVKVDVTLTTTHASLSALVTLALDMCGSVNWCTLRIRGTDKPPKYRGACCMPCSCNHNCSLTNKCCPDFKLQEIVNGSIFASETALYTALHGQSVAVADLYENIYQSKTITEENVNVQCTYARLKPYTENNPISSMYFMVTRCANEETSANVKSKCETSYSENTQSNKHLSDFEPVQSLNTGIVYRNKYCHKCSKEPHNAVTRWNKLIISYNTPISLLRQQTSSFQNMFATIAASSRDLYFEPSEALRKSLPPDPCQIIDVNECMFGNRSNSAGSISKQALFYDAEQLETACKSYPLPVYASVNGTMTVYNNLACMECSNVNTRQACQSAYRLANVPKHHLFVATLATDEEDWQSVDVDDNRSPVDATLETSFSPHCQSGYAYDDLKFLCRKIYCPCGMILQRQQCRPIFGQVRTLFKVYIGISLSGNSRKLTDKAIRDYIYTAIESSNDFTVIDIEFICTSRRNNDPTYLAKIFFSGHESGYNYIKAISMAVLWFIGKTSIVVDNEQVAVHIKIINGAEPVKDTLNYQTATFDCAYSVFSSERPSNEDSSAIIISDCNICYRVEVLQSEIQLKQRFLQIKRTGVTVLISSIKARTPNGTRMLMCVEDVLGKGSLLKFRDSIFKDLETSGDAGSSFETATLTNEQSRYIAFGATGVVLLIVICYLRFARKCAARSGTQRESQVEMIQTQT